MAPESLGIGVAFGQDKGIGDAVNAHSAGLGLCIIPRRRGSVQRVTGPLDIEDADIIGCGNDSPVVGVWHKLHREDVGLVTRHDGGGQVELGGRRVWMIGVDIDSVIIGAGGKQASRSRPTVSKVTDCSTRCRLSDAIWKLTIEHSRSHYGPPAR